MGLLSDIYVGHFGMNPSSLLSYIESFLALVVDIGQHPLQKKAQPIAPAVWGDPLLRA
jgi:hypothetical protein